MYDRRFAWNDFEEEVSIEEARAHFRHGYKDPKLKFTLLYEKNDNSLQQTKIEQQKENQVQKIQHVERSQQVEKQQVAYNPDVDTQKTWLQLMQQISHLLQQISQQLIQQPQPYLQSHPQLQLLQQPLQPQPLQQQPLQPLQSQQLQPQPLHLQPLQQQPLQSLQSQPLQPIQPQPLQSQSLQPLQPQPKLQPLPPLQYQHLSQKVSKMSYGRRHSLQPQSLYKDQDMNPPQVPFHVQPQLSKVPERENAPQQLSSQQSLPSQTQLSQTLPPQQPPIHQTPQQTPPLQQSLLSCQPLQPLVPQPPPLNQTLHPQQPQQSLPSCQALQPTDEFEDENYNSNFILGPEPISLPSMNMEKTQTSNSIQKDYSPYDDQENKPPHGYPPRESTPNNTLEGNRVFRPITDGSVAFDTSYDVSTGFSVSELDFNSKPNGYIVHDPDLYEPNPDQETTTNHLYQGPYLPTIPEATCEISDESLPTSPTTKTRDNTLSVLDDPMFQDNTISLWDLEKDFLNSKKGLPNSEKGFLNLEKRLFHDNLDMSFQGSGSTGKFIKFLQALSEFNS